jgi:hypothetical protein
VTYYNSGCPNVATCEQARTFCSPCRFCDEATEYCHDGTACAPTPELTIETPNGPGCVDIGQAHSSPPALNVIITGRPGATATQYNEHVSCGAAEVAADERGLDGAGRVEDPLETGASTDCASTVLGRWDVEAEIDGQRSNTVEVVYYNSTCAGVATCSQARSHCGL